MITDAEIEARGKAMATALDCFTTRDVSYLTGMIREALVRMRNVGKGPPAVLVGNALLYPVPAFKEWLATNIGNPHPKSRKKPMAGGTP